MRNDYTHILFIIDDSGSMGNLITDSIGGYNKFIEEQRKLDGLCKIDTMTFGSAGNLNYIYKNKDVNEVPELTQKEHNACSGMTALYDAIGNGVVHLGNFLRDMKEADRPSKVLVNVFTDGIENDSKEFSHEDVKKLIEQQKNQYSWEFTFLASDMNAVNTAQNIGITNTAYSANDSVGMKGVYDTISNNAIMYRSAGSVLNVQDEYDKIDKKEREGEATS